MNIVGVTGQAGSGKDEIANHLVKKHGFQKLALADPIKRLGLNVFEFDAIQLWGPSSARNGFDPRYTKCEIRSSGMKFEPGASMSNLGRTCSKGWSDAAINLTQFGPGWISDTVRQDGANRKEALAQLYTWFASLGHHYPELSPRIMLQHLGTEWGREVIDENIWIDNLIRTAEKVLQGYKYDKETGFNGERVPPPTGVVISDVRFANELERIRAAGGRVIKVTRNSAAKKAQKLGISGHASEAEQAKFGDDLFDAVLANEGSLKDLYASVDIVAAAHFGGDNVD